LDRRNLTMTGSYKLLAAKLNRMPYGFPSTENGVELRILKKIFSPEEAGRALKLRMSPEIPKRSPNACRNRPPT
jgi:electron transport complex protein RnfB